MAGRLRLVTDPPDAPLDPVKQLVEAARALEPIQRSPLLNRPGQICVECALSVIERTIPSPQPKGRA